MFTPPFGIRVVAPSFGHQPAPRGDRVGRVACRNAARGVSVFGSRVVLSLV